MQIHIKCTENISNEDEDEKRKESFDGMENGIVHSSIVFKFTGKVYVNGKNRPSWKTKLFQRPPNIHNVHITLNEC